MTYLDLIRDADRKLDMGDITLGEYEEMIEPLNRGIDRIAESGKKVSIPCTRENDVISRKAAIDALEEIMADHPLDGYEDELSLINAIKNLPPAQPEIIRCKDCKHWRFDHTCREHSLVSPMMANEFCSRAERREG